MYTLTRYQPHRSASDHPYTVRARFSGSVVESHHWTHAEALDAWDEAFQAGAAAVHVRELPFVGCAAGFHSHQGPLPEVSDQ